jgi:hypothetical protein
MLFSSTQKACFFLLMSTSDRGYGVEHQKLRKKIQKQMDGGKVFLCWRDGKPINPGEPWDLGHDDNDRTKYMGPEHQRCNRAVQRHKAGNVVDESRQW